MFLLGARGHTPVTRPTNVPSAGSPWREASRATTGSHPLRSSWRVDPVAEGRLRHDRSVARVTAGQPPRLAAAEAIAEAK
ncbi:hypothetical protein GCM10017556_12180 [Micromonospora sagamiensis]|nr:hypothetical protein GCM10017556_12180 [Micromonospora sagamiensis]